MARKASIRYFASREAYYCQLNRKQHLLAKGPDDFPEGPTYAAALAAFKALWSLHVAPTAGQSNTVRVILEMYLRHIETRRSKGTLAMRKHYFETFCKTHGECVVGELRLHDFYTWTDSMRSSSTPGKKRVGWGQSSTLNAIDSLSAAFKWAVKSGYIKANPMDGIERPAKRSRGQETIISPETFRAMLKASTPTFGLFLKALWNTGARPSELAAATASDFNPTDGAIVYHSDTVRGKEAFRHKNANKGQTRMIFFNGEMLDEVRRLAVKYPKGPLFRTRRGYAWAPSDWTAAARRLRVKLNLPNFSVYSLRHTFATEWLKAGKSIDLLAVLLGNSASMIRKHYSHLLSDVGSLRQALEAFRSAAGDA